MVLTYKLYTRAYDSTTWTLLTNWTRPLFSEDKLDETLDMGNIALLNAPLQELEPFTPVKIEIYNDDTLEDTHYYVTAENPHDIRTMNLA